MQSERSNNVLERFRLDWETIGVVLGDTNAIDMPRLNTPTFEAAHEFIVGYGYDPDIESQAGELETLRGEALHFIEKQLVQDPDYPSIRLDIPKRILAEKDVRKLMMMASNDRDRLGRWACSVLRVMHTLTHINNDLSTNFFPAIQKQILDRVLQHTHTDPAGDVYLGRDETGIRLYMLDIKTQKSYDSMVLKLLHKEANTSADIFDRMGFRFIVFNKLDALLALKYLRANVFAFPNVRNNRSRNTLVNLGSYHYKMDQLVAEIGSNQLSEWEIRKKVMEIAASSDCHAHLDAKQLQERNLYSSTEYTSIQVTCRHLVRVMGPPIAPVAGPPQSEGLIEYRFFFPYEIQILDKDSYIESRRGRASHAEYKRAQLRAARERVFPWLVQEDFEPQTS